MRWIIKYLIFISFIAASSCDKFSLNVKCEDCISTEPTVTDLKLKLDDNIGTLGSTVVQVYEGLLEDNILRGTYYAQGSDLSVKVYINKKYTLTAKYDAGYGTVYITVDSATPRVKYVPDQCNDTCYIVYDYDIDLRLKYHK